METGSGLSVLSFAELANQNPADSIYFRSIFAVSLNNKSYKINKINKHNSEIILGWWVSDAINRKCVFDRQKMWPDSVAQSDTRLTGDQESRVRCLPCSQVIVVCCTLFSHLRQTLGT